MSSTSRQIQLALHSAHTAKLACEMLAAHNIETVVTPVELDGVPSGGVVGMSVDAADVMDALRVLESGMSMPEVDVDLKLAGMSSQLLIPVDFSDMSMTACRVGFDLAERLALRVVVLHAYPAPVFTQAPAAPFTGEFMAMGDCNEAVAEVEYDRQAKEGMARFENILHQMQADGKLARVDFTCRIEPGVPEDVIRAFTRDMAPEVVVMATRGKSERDSEMMGSVTAEVLDSCRVPVFTVPRNCRLDSVIQISRLAFFCNLDSQDVVSIDFLMRLFDFPAVEVTLIPVTGKGERHDAEKLEAFSTYLSKNYPEAEFSIYNIAQHDFRASFEAYVRRSGVQMLIVPNKKKNIFARLFNPGIPHRILFERDIPMLALPV